MSAFLGPIHHWLFNKIKLQEQLEERLLFIYKEKYGNEIDEIEKTSIVRYGKPVRKKSLENEIDTSNIHGWLQDKIAKAETRLAFILAEVFRKYKEEAVEIALNEYISQGKQCGNEVKSKNIANTAPQIYKAINDYLLDGMPCDRVNIITENSDTNVQWKTVECLHRNYWKEAGADLDTLYKLRFNWIKAFVEGANEDFQYKYEIGDNIDSLFVHEINKKRAV